MRLALKIFIVSFFLGASGFVFAQSNPNVRSVTYSDISPGVRGSLTIVTESISETSGNVLITGNLKYEFPPQPQTITIDIKNTTGKGDFKDDFFTWTTDELDSIYMLFTNIPLDKSSATNTLATTDKFRITSRVDSGVDFFFPNSNPTYLAFNKFTELPPPVVTTQPQTQTAPPVNLSTDPNDPRYPQVIVPNITTIPIAKSLLVNSAKPLAKSKSGQPTAEIGLLAQTILPEGYKTPAYIGVARLKSSKEVLDYTVDAWSQVKNPDANSGDPSMLGVSNHKFVFEKGTTYIIQMWISDDPNTTPFKGGFLGQFLINADYLFGKPVENVAPGLAPINQAAINSAWSSITSTYVPGSIEFFVIGETDTLAEANPDNSYIFISRIPGLSNSTVTKDVEDTAGNKSTQEFEAFDPTQTGAFSNYISTIINMIYGIIALLAVINIIRYGLMMMVNSAVPSIQKESKSMILNSFLALLVALGSYILLTTINPNLTNFSISPTSASIDITGKQLNLSDVTANGTYTDGSTSSYVGTKGISCTKCFVYPVDPSKCPGNQSRGDHGGYYGGGSLGGNSADLSCPTGTRIQSVAPGVVYSAGSGCKDGNKSCGGGMGNYVIIQHTQTNGKPWYSIYMHLSRVAVKGSQKVEAREEIGKTGNTGDSSGPHLHFETVNENIGRPGKQKYPNCVLGLTCDSYE